jgi:cell division septum initiation protein DivIVA
MAIDYKRGMASASEGGSLGQWRERLVAFMRGSGPEGSEPFDPQATAEFAVEPELDSPPPPQFPLAQRGYDRVAVDQFIAELQLELAEADRELAEVRSRVDSADEVQTELKRIGEQTSAVLIAAYEQRDEILRVAREEAENSVAEAAAKASALVADGEGRRRELEAQNQGAYQERERLLKEIRALSAGLAALADSVEKGTASQA